MRGNWVLVLLLWAVSGGLARADGKRPAKGAELLPSEFYVVTRQCKQLVAEVGSSNEPGSNDLVWVSPAEGYMTSCQQMGKSQEAFRCASLLESKDGTFVSNGSRGSVGVFMVVIKDAPLVVLQDVGSNAMYINTSSRDAVLISRQYFNIGSSSTGKVFAANSKHCKALMLTKDDLAELRKGK